MRGFATEERYRVEMDELVGKRDLDLLIVDYSGHHHSKKEGVGFLLIVEEYLCDITEVIKDSKLDENVWNKTPGERRAK